MAVIVNAPTSSPKTTLTEPPRALNMGNVISYSCNGMGDKLLQSCVDGDVVAVRQVSHQLDPLPCYWCAHCDWQIKTTAQLTSM